MTNLQAITQILRALWSIVKCFGHIFRNLGAAADRTVKSYPWACLISVALLLIIVSSACIGNARAERDKTNTANWYLNQKVDSLEVEIVCMEAKLKIHNNGN